MDAVRYYLGFHLVNGIGPARLARLVERCGSVAAAWKASPALLAAAGLDEKSAAELCRVRAQLDLDAEVARVRSTGADLIPFGDPRYPRLLAEAPGAPILLYLRGQHTPADNQAIAVVGTRQPSAYGREITRRLTGELSAAGLTIVSGLAIGIDTIAHIGALEAGGRTIAVLPTGIDQIYPERNRGLAERIAGQGAVVSEFALGTKPTPQLFPVRNRVISGLALATLVIEAGMDSGALITVRYALEQGRDVFAVPGSIFNPKSAGPHALIRDGAGLVTCVRDILDALNLYRSAAPQHPPVPAREPAQLRLLEGPIEQTVLATLSAEPRHIDELRRACNLPAAEVAAALTMLELAGLARQLPGLLYVLA